MKNQNYALGTRGTLNMLNKVVAKLARKRNNPNAGEKTRKRVVEQVNKASIEKNAPEPGIILCEESKEGGFWLTSRYKRTWISRLGGRSCDNEIKATWCILLIRGACRALMRP